MRWEVAQASIDRADAYLSRGEPGDRERALALLKASARDFEQMGSPGYVDRVKEKLGTLQGEVS
jgi:hypothetical protein